MFRRASCGCAAAALAFTACIGAPDAQQVSASASGVRHSSGPHTASDSDTVVQRQPPVGCDSTRETASAVPLVATPDPLRGLYVNRWAAVGRKVWKLIDAAKRTEINALVIDVKDDMGYVLYRSNIPLAREIGADTTRPMSHARVRAMLDTMRAHDIYPIARVVVMKDPLLASAKPEWAVKRRADGKSWLDKHGRPWLDPHHDGPWRYAADLACEAVALGFSEVQFDYVRFPDEKRLVAEAVFPMANGRERAQVIREQLMLARKRLSHLGVPLAADVFGLTTTDTTDMGIGQKWELFVDAVDVVLPMMYPSHYHRGAYQIPYPNARPYEVIDRGLKDAQRRSAGIAHAARVIPWYQDFTMGPPRYGAAQVRAQMRAGYDNGVQSWILWNAGSRYTLPALLSTQDTARLDTTDIPSASAEP